MEKNLTINEIIGGMSILFHENENLNFSTDYKELEKFSKIIFHFFTNSHLIEQSDFEIKTGISAFNLIANELLDVKKKPTLNNLENSDLHIAERFCMWLKKEDLSVRDKYFLGLERLYKDVKTQYYSNEK